MNHQDRLAYVILTLLCTGASLTAARSSESTAPRTSPATAPEETSASGEPTTEPPVTEVPPTTYGNLTCDLYNAPGVCHPVLTGLTIVTNHSRSGQNKTAKDLGSIFNVLQKILHSSQCLYRAGPLLCRYAFPTCDPAFSIPVYQPICKWDCQILRDVICSVEWKKMEALRELINFGVIDGFDCEKVSPANGGQSPTCISTQDGGPIPKSLMTGDCYNGKGRGYNGTVNVTKSGIPCQSWAVQYPHQYLISHDQPHQYPELEGGHNYCRNPGEKGDKPWCFTTNRTVRWEYCNVPQCSSGPTCQRYTGNLCHTNGTIGIDYIYIDTSIASQERYERDLQVYLNVLNDFPGCREAMAELLCHVTFPLCDLSNDTPRPRPICRGYCQRVWDQCMEFIRRRKDFDPVLGNNVVTIPFNCTTDAAAPNGGDNPECDQPIPLSQRGMISGGTSNCYNVSTKGTDYVGNMSVTVNGIPCQPWDAPSIDKKPAHNAHVHPISSLFRQYLEGHNHCRNPEGRGERPWCYTLNPHIRWQYCDIPVCPSPMPLLYIKIGLPIAVSVVLVITLLLFLLGCVCCKRRRMKHRFKKEQVAIGPDGLVHLTEMKSASCVNPLYSTNQTRASTEFDALEYEASKLPTYPRDNLTYICDLGQGNFGVVVRAEATGIIPGKDKSTVAVKVLKEGSGAQMKEEFFREATLMNNFNHPNILQLLGVCCEHEPYCMILEHMAEGDLNSLLRRNNPNQTFPRGIADFVGFSIKQMVDMAVDIAAGMSYLAKNHYVHRDLATRNCLVDKELRVKIADFGLSQDVYIDDYFRLKDSEMLPIRWMPPEAILYSKFSLQGDVWSFGVVLWEIFSFGVQPYYGRSNEEVVQYVRDGSVLEPPLNCPQEIYDLMVDCWAMDPSERPTSDELYVGLRRWTPEMSATLLVQTRQPNYQNMSTILEYARRSLDGSATKPNGIVNEGIEEERNGDLSEESSHPVGCPYDHLEPQKAVTSTARENNSPAIPLPAIAEA